MTGPAQHCHMKNVQDGAVEEDSCGGRRAWMVSQAIEKEVNIRYQQNEIVADVKNHGASEALINEIRLNPQAII